jgi:hypothetical protein
MDIYSILVHLHSILRWVLLIIMVATIVIAFQNKSTGRQALKPALWTMIMVHLQLLLGLVLYFISPKVLFDGASMKDPMLRFFLVEHILVMLMAITLVTIGYIKARKFQDVSRMNSSLLLFFIIALLLFISRIPWPFLNYGGKWM